MDEEILKILSKEKANLQNLLKFVKNIDKYQSDPLTNLHKIKQEVLKIEKTLKQSKLEDFVKERIEEDVQSIKSRVAEWEEEAKNTFGQKLEEDMRKMGFELRGHYPLLKVSFYTLEVDLENFKVLIWYGPQQEKLATCKLAPEEVVKKLSTIHKKLTQRHFNDNEFLSKVYEAYRISAYRQNKKIGDQIPISDILFEYAFLIQDKKFKINPTKNNYKEYGRVFFSYDLYRLKERRLNDMELNLITATRAYTRKKSDFLWIPSNEKGDGNYISHIKFREVRT
ncbi:hypothetical protein AciM339_1224 [Aciduliprofundum sp. MAR08-339]|uniref:hypothetical protein n=1 Tax=Aciduliprofundum sp. (strain MAR08-339) TaxID=673860 RepID=UPI0002A4B90E|nr:hypothetical protein AciM339_1224 [Aciduliprofundum sp. MAR08-339]